MLPILALLVALSCLAGWIYGEAANVRPVRVISAMVCFVIFSLSGFFLGGLHQALSIGIPVSQATRAYVQATADQLKVGNIEHVRASLNRFGERVQVTYETGAFLRDMAVETENMRQGPLNIEERSESPAPIEPAATDRR